MTSYRIRQAGTDTPGHFISTKTGLKFEFKKTPDRSDERRAMRALEASDLAARTAEANRAQTPAPLPTREERLASVRHIEKTEPDSLTAMKARRAKLSNDLAHERSHDRKGQLRTRLSYLDDQIEKRETSNAAAAERVALETSPSTLSAIEAAQATHDKLKMDGSISEGLVTEAARSLEQLKQDCDVAAHETRQADIQGKYRAERDGRIAELKENVRQHQAALEAMKQEPAPVEPAAAPIE